MNTFKDYFKWLVILAIGLPVSVSTLLSNTRETPSPSPTNDAIEQTKASLVRDCVLYMVTENDSKLERTAKDGIDETLGGDGIDYKALCNWVL